MHALTIETRWAIRIADDLRRAGHTLDGVLKEVGLVRADLATPEDRILYSSYVGLIERAATLLGDPGYGLKLGASYGVRDVGLHGFIALNSATLGDALASIERYVRVTNEGIDAVFEADELGATLRFRETDPSLRGLRHNSEYVAAIFVRACRDITRKRISPVRAEFMHGRPNVKVSYAEYLDCPVKFHAKWDAVVYDAETMRQPVIGADSKLLKVLEHACRQILGPTRRKKDIVHDVRELIIDKLARGTAGFDDVARELNMSTKTLERRLADRKTTFSVLLDDIRSGLAKRYLTDTDLRLEQIAYLTGYSESAALVRAFRRWTGTTPMQFRAKHR